jgi:thioredoxin-related protein
MNRLILVFSLIVFSLTLGVAGDKDSLNWLSFDQAKTEAAKSNKKILVDVYTDWCKWCKKMDADTYADPKVMKYLKEKFVVAKLNAESDDKVTYDGKKQTSAEFARLVGVEGFPTLLFFEPNGKVITSLSSYLDPSQMIHVAKFIGESKYEKMSFEEFEKNYKD